MSEIKQTTATLNITFRIRYNLYHPTVSTVTAYQHLAQSSLEEEQFKIKLTYISVKEKGVPFIREKLFK